MKSINKPKSYLLAICFFLLAGLAGCSSDSSSSSSNALPEPSVNCGGSSCVE